MSKGDKRSPKGEYQTGYCCPPKSGQFKPGQSGNPKGAKKKEDTLLGALRAELAATQKVRENGKEKTLTKAQIMAKQWVRQALEGRPAAIEKIAKLEPKFAPQIAASVSAAMDGVIGDDLTETDLAMMRWFIQGSEAQNCQGPSTEQSASARDRVVDNG